MPSHHAHPAVPLPAVDPHRETGVVTLADGRRLAYTEWGDRAGFPVFYFHGTPGSRWEGAFADHAARRHRFRLVAVDRPGFGRSTFQPGRRFRDWPADVRALADSLGIAEFGVVGHSGAGPHLFACGSPREGGRVAFVGGLAPWGPATHPEVMAGLHALDRMYAALARRVPAGMRAAFAPVGWCARYSPRLFAAAISAAVAPADKAALRDPRLRAYFRLSQREAFRQGSRGPAHEAAIAYRDWDLDLTSLRTPVHIWLGDEDIFVPRAMGAYLERVIPGVDFHWVGGAGHFDLGRWDDILAACRTHV